MALFSLHPYILGIFFCVCSNSHMIRKNASSPLHNFIFFFKTYYLKFTHFPLPAVKDFKNNAKPIACVLFSLTTQNAKSSFGVSFNGCFACSLKCAIIKQPKPTQEPDFMNPRTEKTRQRFSIKVSVDFRIKTHPKQAPQGPCDLNDPLFRSPCWIWQSALDNVTGQALFWYHGKTVPAARAAWLLFRADHPEPDHPDNANLGPLHRTCDSPRCVNPWHRDKRATNTPRARARWQARLLKRQQQHPSNPLHKDNLEPLFNNSNKCLFLLQAYALGRERLHLGAIFDLQYDALPRALCRLLQLPPSTPDQLLFHETGQPSGRGRLRARAVLDGAPLPPLEEAPGELDPVTPEPWD